MKRIVGLLGWLGVVLVLAAVALRFTRPELGQWSQGFATAGLVVIGLYALTQWRDIARSFQGRNVRYGSLAAGSVVLVLAILVALNWISSRRTWRWDVTEAQQFTLADQTVQILSSLDRPLVVKAFHDGGANTGVSESVLRDKFDEYAYHSSQLQVEYVNVNTNPLPAREAGVASVPTILFEYDGRSERTTSTDEQALTNTMKKVIEGQPKRVYFIQGHGEHDTAASDARGYASIAQSLGEDNFQVEKLTLAQTGTIPDDASVVVIAGPHTDYFAPEIDALRAYLGRGGKMLLMIDPPESSTAPDMPNLVALAREWAIDVGSNLVVDESGIGQIFGAGAETPVAMPVSHPITADMRSITAFPLARSVTPLEGGAETRFSQKLVETSPASWAESDLKSLYETGRPARDLDAGDINGPVSLAAAVSAPASAAPAASAPESPETPAPETRVVVVGDSDFASNSALGVQGNKDLFLNMANWLALQENLIAIRPRDPEDRRINLTADQSQLILWSTILIIPGLLLLTGVLVWWRRR